MFMGQVPIKVLKFQVSHIETGILLVKIGPWKTDIFI